MGVVLWLAAASVVAQITSQSHNRLESFAREGMVRLTFSQIIGNGSKEITSNEIRNVSFIYGQAGSQFSPKAHLSSARLTLTTWQPIFSPTTN